MSAVADILARAKKAKPAVNTLPQQALDGMVRVMAAQLPRHRAAILAANAEDMENAKGRIPDVMLDRLRLDEGRIDAMAEGMLAVAALESPLGMVEKDYHHPNGLDIQKVRVPLGVVAIIYESRPNVTSDAAALCLKSGNVCILRGGSDAIRTNTAVVTALRAGIEQEIQAGRAAPEAINALQLVEDTSHDSARALMEARGLVDLLIPRGGAGLIRAVVQGARGVPVIETGTGICHIYVDKTADLAMAAAILYNAKTSRPSVCNSAEVCLVHRDVAAEFLPAAQRRLAEKNVQLRCDAPAMAILQGVRGCVPAGPDDFDTEFLDYVLAVAVVGGVDEAVAHINAHGTHHSDAIVTTDDAAARTFTTGVDSAAVYVNASTRFTDGGEFGLGCEMGISTQKTGARGPMGLYELTSYKYVIQGNGQTR